MTDLPHYLITTGSGWAMAVDAVLHDAKLAKDHAKELRAMDCDHVRVIGFVGARAGEAADRAEEMIRDGKGMGKATIAKLASIYEVGVA